MDVQELLLRWREVINTEREKAKSENRENLVDTDFEQLLMVAETQNACIKAIRKGSSVEELETWLTKPNDLLDNKSPVDVIQEGQVQKVYQII